MDASIRQQIRIARDQHARSKYPFVHDSQLTTSYGICLNCNSPFEPTIRNRPQIYCREQCRKNASLRRTRRSRRG